VLLTQKWLPSWVGSGKKIILDPGTGSAAVCNTDRYEHFAQVLEDTALPELPSLSSSIFSRKRRLVGNYYKN
jgi:hypothetical protein